MRLLSLVVALTALVCLAIAVASCGGSAASLAQRPTATFAAATGAPSCRIIEGRSEPFVIDWPGTKRSDLELAAKEGLIAVAYDCDTLRVLADCHIEGNYRFAGVTEREELLTLNDAEEVRANLPLSGAGIAGRLGGDFEKGTNIEIAVATVGRRTSSRHSVLPSDLKGECEGATHFVRSVTVGAFAMRAGTRAKARGMAEIFGFGASSQHESAALGASKDGSLESCRTASPEQSNPPAQCGAPLRISLREIRGTAAGDATEDEASLACPEGLKATDQGKCARPSASEAHICAASDFAECTRECDKGSMASCAILGRMYETGNGAAKDIPKALELLQRACNGGATPACGRLGELLLASGKEAQGAKLLESSCADGWMKACTILGTYYRKTGAAQHIDPVALLKRGCDGGDAESCWTLGALFSEGIGVRKNDNDAYRNFQLGCEGGARLGCMSLAKAVEEGRGVAPDLARAFGILTNACEHGDSYSCGALSSYYFAGKGTPADASKGLSLLTRACEGNDRGSCVTLGLRYANGLGVTRDKERGIRYLERACEVGLDPGCMALHTVKGSR